MYVKTDENSLEIHLQDIPSSKGNTSAYKLYKIVAQDDYEYLKVYMNEKETYFSTVGINGPDENQWVKDDQ